jgi:hypothetical protein
MNSQPDAARHRIDDGEVVDREFAVASGDTPPLLDLVEEPLGQGYGLGRDKG